MSEKEWLHIFAKNLATIMYENRMTQKELAEMIGTSESTVSRYLREVVAPSIFTIINISYALHCTIDELVDFGSTIE